MKSPNRRHRKDRVADDDNHLECGRRYYGLRAWADAYLADIPNYTDQTPVIQISEVVVGS